MYIQEQIEHNDYKSILTNTHTKAHRKLPDIQAFGQSVNYLHERPTRQRNIFIMKNKKKVLQKLYINL